MNMDQLNDTPNNNPFVQTDRLTIWTLHPPDGSKITGFKVLLDGVEKTFKVKETKRKDVNEILEAWLEMEKYTGKIL